jgi:hypothetical protein
VEPLSGLGVVQQDWCGCELRAVLVLEPLHLVDKLLRAVCINEAAETRVTRVTYNKSRAPNT